MDERACLIELQQLALRAEKLFELGSQRDAHSMEQASEAYKALKDDLAERLRGFQRERRRMELVWWASTFEAALRQAHIEMRAPTNTSPRNSGWQRSVQDVGEELRYHLAAFEKAVGAS